MTTKRFSAEVTADGRRVFVALPFDPDDVWGARERHHVTGTVDGHAVRGVLHDGRLMLGPAWRRDSGVAIGNRVAVVLSTEGPQRAGGGVGGGSGATADLAPDVAAALAAHPEAAATFDSLATFYRKGYLSWIDATKRRPEVRAERIATMVERLKAGLKERPRGG